MFFYNRKSRVVILFGMRQILVYGDAGVAISVFEQTVKSLQKEVDPQLYTVRSCDAGELLKTEWEETTALLVIPGGRDLQYQQKLFPAGTRRIFQFVAQGGSYLGFCAGAYFASSEIEFGKGEDIEVIGKRDLGFFPGRAVGPAYGRRLFRYDSDAGMEAASIEWGEGESCRAFFNGGCFFENAHLYPEVRVIGTYADLPGKPAAAVYCSVEKGRAVLSGAHLEYSVQNMEPASSEAKRVHPLLLAGEEKRRACFRSLLLQAGLSLLTTSQKYSRMKLEY